MQNLGGPVGRATAQSPFSDFSPQAAEQGQITGSNDEDVTMTGGGGNPATSARPKRPPVPKNLLKELAPFNRDSVVKEEPDITGLNLMDVHNTRGLVRTLNTITTGSNPETLPLDSQNPIGREDEQPRTTRRNSVRSRNDARSQRSNRIPEDSHAGPTTEVRHLSNVSGARTAEDSVREEAKRQRRLKAEGKKAWTEWRARKHHFRDLIRAPSFPHSEDTDGSKRTKLESMGPDGFMMFMEQDFPVLAPTAAQLWDLPAFISKVESKFGRERGFVKIILPYELRSRYRPPQPTVAGSSTDRLSFSQSSSSIRPYLTKLDIHKPFESGMLIYRVAMRGAVVVLVSEWEEAMQKYHQEIMNRTSEEQRSVCDPSTIHLRIPPSEKEMIADGERASDDMYYATDIPESPSIRQAFKLGGPYLGVIPGNRVQDPRFNEPEMNGAHFQIAGAKGSSFGLAMTNHAAYSLNYLHRGAPKRWVVIEPDAHQQLEELLHPEVELVAERLVQQSRTKFKPPIHPPLCDQFLGHQPLYIPMDTLESHGIAHREVVQYQGQMIVTFPSTYCQGISAGPSVAEVMAFGNDRWETISKERIYQPCHPNCSGPKVPEKSGQVDLVFPGHTGGRIDGYVPNSPDLEEDVEVSSGVDARSRIGSEATRNAVAGFQSDEMDEDEPFMWIK